MRATGTEFLSLVLVTRHAGPPREELLRPSRNHYVVRTGWSCFSTHPQGLGKGVDVLKLST